MGNTFRVINYDGDIEISIYKKANAVFKTNEYNETEDVCIHKETINIFNLLKENQELKKQLEVPETCNLKTLEDYKSYYEDTTKEQILEDTYIEYCAYVNLAHRYSKLEKQLEKYENPEDMTLFAMWCTEKVKDENEKLKRQFEENKLNHKQLKDLDKIEKSFIEIKNQQKEFIKYLEDGIEKATTNPYTKLSEYGMNRIHIYNEILQKYKEIIGDDK